MALKRAFVTDLLGYPTPTEVKFQGWVSKKRHRGGIVFLDLCDRTGFVQAVAEKETLPGDVFKKIVYVPLESCVEVSGILQSHRQKAREISIRDISIIGAASKQISPQPRGNVNVFDPALAEHLLSNRHIYLRNPQIAAILQFRDLVKREFRRWFAENGFIELDAPILTPVPLYEDRTAMPIEVHGERIFLTQCVGYYLDAAAEALERVYNMGPSFRGEESHSKRHLMEYHHVKAELSSGNLEDVIRLVEEMLAEVTIRCAEGAKPLMANIKTSLSLDAARIPYDRISYRDAIKWLQGQGHAIKFGKSIGSEEETMLGDLFTGPFWIFGPPRLTEPFPYVINDSDPETVNVADLIAPRGFGEILGTAEKIHDLKMLDERLREKGKFGDPRYEWIRELHKCGCSPHIAFGMGLERFIRWILGLPHVRDAIAFPRIFRRRVYP
jgi:asparaginyl-tRNA synthetase